MTAEAEPLVIFTPSGRRGRFADRHDGARRGALARRRHRLGLRRARDLRPLPGRARASASSRSTGSRRRRTTSRPSRELEPPYREAKGLAADRRLSCTATVCGDVVVDVPPESQVHRQVVRKGLDVRDVRRSIRSCASTTSRSSRPSWRRRPATSRACSTRSSASGSSPTSRPTSRSSARSSRRSRPAGTGSPSRSTTAAPVIGVWPGFHDRAYGVAIDVGSTTIAGHLADLADGAVLATDGVMNPQIRFGEDLMSRVSYAMLHPEGAGEMTAAVRAALDGLVAGLADAGRHRARREILELTVVGNPIMHHLVLGIDPMPLGGAPFALATDRAVRTTAARARPARPSRRARLRAALHRRPRRRRHRGRDPRRGSRTGRADDAGRRRRHERRDRARRPRPAARGVEPDRARRSRARRSPAASAPRPARSSASASTATTLEPRYPGHRRRTPGPTSPASRPASPETGITGICGSGIVEVVAELFLAGVITADGVIDGSLAARTPRIVADGRTFGLRPPRGRSAAARASSSPRTTSAPSSSPRPRSTRASGC